MQLENIPATRGVWDVSSYRTWRTKSGAKKASLQEKASRLMMAEKRMSVAPPRLKISAAQEHCDLDRVELERDAADLIAEG